MIREILLISGVVAFFMCHFSIKAQQADGPSDLDTLAAWMTGSFSTHEQSLSDPDYNDYLVHLARIWKHRSDGYWLYVEQASAAFESQPFRQRIFHLAYENDSIIQCSNFRIENALNFVEAWRYPSIFDTVDQSSLIEREGCAVYFYRDGRDFSGRTRGKKCESHMRGSSYTTSQVRLTDTTMFVVDLWYDSDDSLVYGPKMPGYIFKKIVEKKIGEESANSVN